MATNRDEKPQGAKGRASKAEEQERRAPAAKGSAKESEERVRNYKGIGLRMREWEYEAIKSACEALSHPPTTEDPGMKVEMAQLFYTGALEEAMRLGFTPAHFEDRTIKRRTVWPYVPERPEGTRLESRTTVSIHPLHLRTIEQASRSVVDDAGEDVPLALFLVGSALRFIAVRQKKEPGNHALQAVKLPQKFKE